MEGEQNNISMEGGGKSGSSAGPIISVIVILVVIILGGLYFWSQSASDYGVTDNSSLMTDQTVEAIKMQGQADDTSSIEADLDATDIENLDAELNAS